ncbi:hypothetical protein [Altererythrobacter palmitatis]|uniref:hypothetical protein n=1 Tax=Alteraurantiacibacter palmitatis TaxID=2054628 RepID=UPI0030169A63
MGRLPPDPSAAAVRLPAANPRGAPVALAGAADPVIDLLRRCGVLVDPTDPDGVRISARLFEEAA